MAEGRKYRLGLERALLVDEVGIETGRHGAWRLKTTHQPIYRQEGSELVPFAVEARVAPQRDGELVTPAEFFDEVPASDRPFVEVLCTTLHLRNYWNIGVDEPERFELYLTVDPRHHQADDPAGAAASIAATAAAIGLPADRVTCEIADAALLDDETLAAACDALRGQGAQISIAEFRTAKPAIDRVTQFQPDIVKIDGAWFRTVQEASATAQLFPAVITAFSGLGARLLVQGIETPAELKAAIDAGADYLQGRLLAEPKLAGVIIDEEPLTLPALLGGKRREAGNGGGR